MSDQLNQIFQEAEDDEQAIQYIRQHLPQELKEKFTDELLYYFLDVLIEYYGESGILDADLDEEGYVDIDVEEVATYLARKADKEGMGKFEVDDLIFVVEANLEYEEEMLD